MPHTADTSATERPRGQTADLVARVHDLLMEADEARRPFIERAELNNAQYLGAFGEQNDTLHGHSAFIINKTQPAVITHTQVQTEQDPRVDMAARESGRSGEFWMTRQALLTIRGLAEQGHIHFEDDDPAAVDIDGDALADEISPAPGGDAAAGTPVETQGFVFEKLDAQPNQPAFEVTEGFVARVQPLLAQWPSAMPALEGGEPLLMQPAIKPQDIIEITDDLAADVQHNNCEILWDRGNNSRWLFDNIHLCNIIGWQVSLYQWDAEEHRDQVFNIHPRHVWLPPEATSIEDCDHAILRDPISRSQAIERYPHLAKKIKAYASEDRDDWTPGDAMGGTYEVGGPWMETAFKRSMIDVWTCWLRGERYPMTPDEAMERGVVIMEKTGFILLGEDEEGNETKEPTNPKSPNWPTRRAVRQVQIVADEVVADEQCPYWDIPLLLNKNIPVPFRWVGQGEPERLEWLDRLIMKLASSLFDIVRYARSPQPLYPDGVWNALKEQRASIAAHPNRAMHIEDGVYDKYRDILAGGNGFYVKPPPFPEGAIELLREMLQLHDILSGNTAEMQGRASYSGQSGKAIDQLQTAARGIIGFKATNTEAQLVRLIRLRVHATSRRGWLPLHQWRKFNDKYTAPVLGAIRARAKKIDIDIKVELASGAGEVRRVQQAQAREDRAAGIISHRTTLEKLEYDADEELSRLAEEQPPVAGAPVAGAPQQAMAA